mmetsp:Transcript_61051/g.70939  ORF Transcript_61051/g.70939 Transcript_61051/m.70939 type:complete len:267 (+) Transcript_61051:178-978(+)
MTDVTFALRRLQKLNDKCGGGKKNVEAEVDTSKMSPYEQKQYKIAVDMKRTRENILELDNLGEKASATRKAELANAIRKDLNSMKKEAAALQRISNQEKKSEEYSQLVSHIKKTDQLYRARFGGRAVDDAAAGPTGSNATTFNPVEMNDLGAPMVSLREDEEFVQFFAQTQKNDVTIDQALDRIAQGVTRLHETATNIKSELQVQNTLLDETEAKLDKVHGNLKGVNKKLKETIKQVDSDRLCVYLFCCLVLLGLAGGIYYVIRSN